MTQRISNDEIFRLIEQWQQSKSTLRHGPGELSPEIPVEVRFIQRSESEMSAAGVALMAANPGTVAPVKMVRFNPVTADLLKTVGTRLSVAAHERELDTAGVDAVATDPVAATSQDWAAADLTIGNLKIMATAPDNFVSPAAKEFQRQQFRKAINDLAEQGRIEHERDLAEMRKQPGFAPLQADPQWKQLESDWRATVEKYRQRRGKWSDKFYEDLSPQEQDEERQLTNEQEREMSELRWRSYKLQQTYGVHSPDPLRTPDHLVKSIRVWQMWAETLNQSGDNQNRYATERAAEARKAALLLRLRYPSLASVPPPLADAMHDLGVLLDWAITANRDLSQAQPEQPKSSANTSMPSPMQTPTDSIIAAEISEFEAAWAAMWKAHSEQRSREILGQTPTGMLERAEAVSRYQRACARLAQRARERGYDPRPLELIAIDPTNPPLKEKEMAGGILQLLQAAGGGTLARPKASKDEANIKAREFLRQNPNATSRELATGIGCSSGLVSKLPAWQAVKEQRDKGRQPKKSGNVSLTPAMERTIGVEDESLAKLIREQDADAEPSPLQDDSADDRHGAPRRAKIYRKP